MSKQTIRSIAERMLTDPSFRRAVARDAESALSGYDLDPAWREALQEVARSEDLPDLGQSPQTEADRKEIEEKRRQREEEEAEHASEEVEASIRAAKDDLEMWLRIVLDSAELKTQAIRALGAGASSSEGVQEPDPAEGGDRQESVADSERRGAEPLRHRGRSVSLPDFIGQLLNTPGVGAAIVIGGALLALVLSAWMLTQIQGPRDVGLPDPSERTEVLPATERPEGERESAESDGSEAAAPPTPTPTETDTPQPMEINFNADAYEIERGECTTLRWRVTGAEVVSLLGEEVEYTEAQEVCPGESRGYRLSAENASEEASSYFEIEVTEPERDRPGCVPSDENNFLCP